MCDELELLAAHWQEVDEGIWEVRGGARNFLQPHLMCLLGGL
jgi:hypothetical protein